MSVFKRAATVLLAFAVLLIAASCGISISQRGNGTGEGAAGEISGGAAGETGRVKEADDSAGSASGQKGSGSAGTPEIFPARDNYLTDSKWGYIDKAGMFVIQPSFSQAFRFQSNGLAVAGRGDRVGLIDRTGSFITEPVYTYINEYQEGRLSRWMKAAMWSWTQMAEPFLRNTHKSAATAEAEPPTPTGNRTVRMFTVT
jgi:hypothetical protein